MDLFDKIWNSDSPLNGLRYALLSKNIYCNPLCIRCDRKNNRFWPALAAMWFKKASHFSILVVPQIQLFNIHTKTQITMNSSKLFSDSLWLVVSTLENPVEFKSLDLQEPSNFNFDLQLRVQFAIWSKSILETPTAYGRTLKQIFFFTK